MVIKTKENKTISTNDFLKIDEFINSHKNEIEKYGFSNLIFIYKITNKNNKKIYIGKTKNLRRRASEYIGDFYEKKGKKRTINIVIQNEGIKNFVMEPIDFALDKIAASSKEIYYITKLDACNPNIGYNMDIQSVNTPLHLSNHTPRKQSSEEKMKRSLLFCGINIDDKKIIFSTGLKLFGDYISRSKDEVKSAARRATPLNGFYLYYLTNQTFQSQISYAKKMKEKKTSYENVYETFLRLSKILVDILTNNKVVNGYIIEFIHQYDNDKGYKKSDYKIFIKHYKSMVENGIIEAIKIDHDIKGRL